MRSAIAVLVTVGAAACVLAATGLISSSLTWGMPHDPVSVFGTYLLYSVVFTAPLIPVGLVSIWLVLLFRLPRPGIEMLVWGLAGALFMQVLWNPMIDGIADASPSTVSAAVLALAGLGCAVLGGIAAFVERRLTR